MVGAPAARFGEQDPRTGSGQVFRYAHEPPRAGHAPGHSHCALPARPEHGTDAQSSVGAAGASARGKHMAQAHGTSASTSGGNNDGQPQVPSSQAATSLGGRQAAPVAKGTRVGGRQGRGTTTSVAADGTERFLAATSIYSTPTWRHPDPELRRALMPDKHQPVFGLMKTTTGLEVTVLEKSSGLRGGWQTWVDGNGAPSSPVRVGGAQSASSSRDNSGGERTGRYNRTMMRSSRARARAGDQGANSGRSRAWLRADSPSALRGGSGVLGSGERPRTAQAALPAGRAGGGQARHLVRAKAQPHKARAASAGSKWRREAPSSNHPEHHAQRNDAPQQLQAIGSPTAGPPDSLASDQVAVAHPHERRFMAPTRDTGSRALRTQLKDDEVRYRDRVYGEADDESTRQFVVEGHVQSHASSSRPIPGAPQGSGALGTGTAATGHEQHSYGRDVRANQQQQKADRVGEDQTRPSVFITQLGRNGGQRRRHLRLRSSNT